MQFTAQLCIKNIGGNKHEKFLNKALCTRTTSSLLFRVFRPVVGGNK